MAEWAHAPEVQLELHRWMTSEQGNRYRRAWIRGEAANEPQKAEIYDAFWVAEAQKLLTSHAIWVDPEMTDLVTAARDGFKPEAMEREDFIVHTGFCYFAKPLLILDRNKMPVSLGAISWMPVMFTAKAREQEESETYSRIPESGGSEMISHDPDLTEDMYGMCIALHSSTLCEEDVYYQRHQAARRETGAGELVPLHFTYVLFGDPLDDGHLYDEQGRPTAADEWWKTIQTVLRLMQQRIAVQSDSDIARPTRRRWKREVGTEPKEMLVIRLRRPATRSEEPVGSTVEWSHRWIVGGFWRNQWYPSLGRHRQVYINDYVKGPEDKPLVVKRRYYRWDR